MPIDRAAIALLACALIAAEPARHAVAGHYNVPRVRGPAGPRTSGNLVTNPDFETGRIDGGWYQCGDVPAFTTTEHPHDGAYDEFSGAISGTGEPLGNSGVCQQITVPRDGLLSAELYQLSNEPDTSFAYQEADLLDDSGNVVVNLYKSVNHRAAWVRGSWNLGAYAGRTYWLYFGVHGDGYARHATQQFLDDVVLTGSAAPSAEATPHATAGPNARVRPRR